VGPRPLPSSVLYALHTRLAFELVQVSPFIACNACIAIANKKNQTMTIRGDVVLAAVFGRWTSEHGRFLGCVLVLPSLRLTR
jgi:hypothetical protein